MSSTSANYSITILDGQTTTMGVKVLPVRSVNIETITSLDEFKSKKINFRSLRPAILHG